MAKEENKIVKSAEEQPVSPIQNMSEGDLAALMRMIDSSRMTSSQNEGFSVYGQRDPKKIETVNVRQMDGKFVVGFKNHQKNPYKKDVTKYTTMEFDPMIQKPNQPFITLLLSDGSEDEKGNLVIEEKHVRLLDYVENRDTYVAKVSKAEKKEVIDNFGILGGHAMASEIDAKGNKVSYPSVNKETKKEILTFYVELPGFSKPVEFVNDPTGPLA